MSAHRTPARVRFASSLTRATSKLSDHKIALGLLVAAIGGFLAYIAWVSINGPPFQNRYEINVEVPADSPILQPGDAVRVAGRFAGFVIDVEPVPDEEALVVKTELDPQFAPIGMDASSNVKVRSLVYLTYLEIFPGDRSNPMPEGGTIPVENSGSGVDLLEVVQLFDAHARKTFRELSVGLGTGLAGRGVDLNVVLADLDETARDATAQFQALTADKGSLRRLIAGLARVTSGLQGEQPDDVAALLTSGSAAMGAFAARREDLGRTLDLLRPFEDEFLATTPIADPLLRDAAAFSEEVTPLAEQITASLPQLNQLLALGEELSSETLAITEAADPVLEGSAPQFAALYPVIASLLPFLDSLTPIIDAIEPYEEEIVAGSRGLISASKTLFPEGQSAPGANALRFGAILFCATARNPYPPPHTAIHNSEPCGP